VFARAFAEAALAIISYIREVYERTQEFKYAGPYGEDGFIEIYNARVRGQPIGGAVEVTRNAVGQVQHIAGHSLLQGPPTRCPSVGGCRRPRESLLSVQRATTGCESH
jgi:hypothetical protein